MTYSNRIAGLLFVPLFASGLSCAGDGAFDDGSEDIVFSESAATSKPLVLKGDNGSPAEAFPLGRCEGDCDKDADCGSGLSCFQREGTEAVPGCSGAGKSGKDYCFQPEQASSLVLAGDNGSPSEAFPLGRCEGDCDKDADCSSGLVCFQRTGTEAVPGCSGAGASGKDYCYQPDDAADLVLAGDNGTPADAFPLGECEGDCDEDADCGSGLSCFQRSGTEPVPGCGGLGNSGKDYCYKRETDGVQPVPPGAFTIGFLPDIQNFMTDSDRTRKEALVASMFNFFVDNKDALNVQLVAQLGDSAFNTSNNSTSYIKTQWERVDETYDIFRDAQTPFTVCRGNHDFQPYFDDHFPIADFEHASYWGGAMGESLQNAHYLLSAGGQDFVIVVLEYRSESSASSVDAWANSILKQYEDRPAIVISHNLHVYIDSVIRKNDNVFMAIMGHDTMDYHWTQRSVGGREQHLFVFDYQPRSGSPAPFNVHTHGSVVKYFTFAPAKNSVSTKTYSVKTNRYLTESDCNYDYFDDDNDDRLCRSFSFDFDMN